MIEIFVGTTPTIVYTFKVVDVKTIIKADLTIKQRTGIVLEKSLADASMVDNTLQWTLTQEETLSLGARGGTIMLNWLTSAGLAGVSKMEPIKGIDNHRREVMR